jgi:hypothetical protein
LSCWDISSRSIDILDQLRLTLTDWAIIIAGMAVLVGIYNLVAVHMEKIRAPGKRGHVRRAAGIFPVITFGWVWSLDLTIPLMRAAVDAVIVPVEASLMAILAVTLVYASIRLLRRRTDVMSVIFLVVAVLFCLPVMPTPFGPIPGSTGSSLISRVCSREAARAVC